MKLDLYDIHGKQIYMIGHMKIQDGRQFSRWQPNVAPEISLFHKKVGMLDFEQFS